jgi:hypothetical protein
LALVYMAQKDFVLAISLETHPLLFKIARCVLCGTYLFSTILVDLQLVLLCHDYNKGILELNCKVNKDHSCYQGNISELEAK